MVIIKKKAIFVAVSLGCINLIHRFIAVIILYLGKLYVFKLNASSFGRIRRIFFSFKAFFGRIRNIFFNLLICIRFIFRVHGIILDFSNQFCRVVVPASIHYHHKKQHDKQHFYFRSF